MSTQVGDAYLIYGLRVRSELPLLELPPLPDEVDAHEPGAHDDIRILAGEVDIQPPAHWAAHGPHFRAHGDAAWFEMPGVGRFAMHGGHEIRYHAAPGADAADLRLVLLGTCIGVLLFQRGYFVLHGNSVRIADPGPERAIVCAGRSGAGKSTTAAAFLRRGFTVLSDDVTTIAPDGRLIAGLPRIRLWQDSADHLGVDTRDLQAIRPGMEKYYLPLQRDAQHATLPVAAVYILRPEPIERLRIEVIEGAERLRLLHRHTYRIGFMEAMGLRAQHLRQVGQLASRARVVRIWRPERDCTPDDVVNAILGDLAGAAV